MITTNYSIKTCHNAGLNYTRSNGSTWYQKSLEIRERICFRMTELTVPIYKKFFKSEGTKWRISIEKLGQYEAGTLGKTWFDFYQNQTFGISPNYEEHDICHVVLGYKTSIVEETRMYSFLLGSGKISAPTLFTIIIGSIVLPEFIGQFYRDYRLGKTAVNFSKWDFRFLLNEPIDTLRKMIFKNYKLNKAILF